MHDGAGTESSAISCGAMGVATVREYGLHIAGAAAEPASGEIRELTEPASGGYKRSGFGRELALETLDRYRETKSVVVSTGSRAINPFGL